MDAVFPHTALSLVLAGAGDFLRDGTVLPLATPCAVWEPCGSHLRYGPRPRWEEFFIVWCGDDHPRLAAAGLYRAERPWWRLPARATLWPWIERLTALARRPAGAGTVDRIDRLAEQLAAEAVLLGEAQTTDPVATAINEWRARIDADPLAVAGDEAMANRLGLHPGSLARRWRALVGEPLGSYQRRARLRLACRLLVETTQPVAGVAVACGFDDPSYFSRCFARTIGCPAQSYRRRHRLP